MSVGQMAGVAMTLYEVSPKELGQAANVHECTISRWKQGGTVSAETAFKLNLTLGRLIERREVAS